MANSTTVGTLTLTGLMHAVCIEATYLDDDNGNNSVSIQYRRQGAGSWKPFSSEGIWNNRTDKKVYAILPCQGEGLTYEVEVTFSDPDTVTGTNPLSGSVTTMIVEPSVVEDPGQQVWVDASRPDDTGDGFTKATAKKTIAAGVALLTTNNGADGKRRTLNIVPGTYQDQQLNIGGLNGGSSQWVTIRKESGAPGEVVLDGTNIPGGAQDANAPIGVLCRDVSTSYVHVRDITFSNWKGAQFNGATGRIESANAAVEIQHIRFSRITSKLAGESTTDVGGDFNVRLNAGKIHDLVWYDCTFQEPQRGGASGESNSNGIRIRSDVSPDVAVNARVVVYKCHYPRVNSKSYSDAVVAYPEFTSTAGWHSVEVWGCDGTVADDFVSTDGATRFWALGSNQHTDCFRDYSFTPAAGKYILCFRNKSRATASYPWTEGSFIKFGVPAAGIGCRAYAFIVHNTVDRDAVANQQGPTNTNLDTVVPDQANWRMYNNIFDVSRYVYEWINGNRQSPPENNVYDYNLLRTGAANKVKMSDEAPYSQVVYTNLSTYVSSENLDTRSLLGQDPLLNSDFSLQASSPCRNAGLVLDGFNRNTDVAAWEMSGTAPDIGAVEYQESGGGGQASWREAHSALLGVGR